MFKIGNFELSVINDAITHVDGGGAFGLVPRKLWGRYFKYDEDNLIPMSQNCLYVFAHGKHIVIDTGLGTRMEDKQRRFWQVTFEGGLVRGLASLGISTQQVDIVINTHLHSDHCAGNMRYADDAHTTLVPTFPNAQYFVHRGEYEQAMRPNERTAATYIPQNYAPLVESGQMTLLDGVENQILAGIRCQVASGHTPYHMSVEIHDGADYAMFVCDVASYAVHMERLGWMTAYDVEPLVNMETKRKIQQWALQHNALLIFPHDGTRPMGHLQQNENGSLQLVPFEEAVINA
jgi:glyoxylase-like metal-dependent hydrolase (beta-lactamase superfamily II)